jgi:hypothetical protein
MFCRIESWCSSPWLIISSLVAVLAIAGAAEGRFHDGSVAEQALEDAADRMLKLPLQSGRWVAEELPVDPEEMKIAGARAAIVRRYTHTETSEAVTVMMICGPPGPVSVHPPTACYRARGYRLEAEPQKVAVRSGVNLSQEFLAAEFANSSGYRHDRVGILWAWSTGSDWSVPENPRLSFYRQSALYKLYVTWSRSDQGVNCEDSIPTDFCREFLHSCRSGLAAGSS